MKHSSTMGEVVLAELSKLITRSRKNDIRAYNSAVIEKMLQIVARFYSNNGKLAIDKNKIYALKNGQGNNTRNPGEIIKVAEQLQTRLFACDVRPGETAECTYSTSDAPLVTKEQTGKTIKRMKIANATGQKGTTEGILKEAGDIVHRDIALLF